MNSFTIGSLFDGSGGFPLTAHLCGGVPLWASEVEPYPIAVTKSRFPNMEHLGDISKVKGDKIPPVDVITFGSPCQDLSIAGKRAGLKHAEKGDEETTRSGLFMEAVRIIKEMRQATNGIYPTFAIWENVPGAFTSNNGHDFRAVCEELIKITEPEAPALPMPPKNQWPYADVILGDQWSLAWRVFDAQFWGVPQRRRRIYLVADFRGQRAHKILFEREGLRGYFAQSGTQRQSTAGNVKNSTGEYDKNGKCIVVDQGSGKSYANFYNDLSPTLTCTHGGEPAVAYTLKIRSGCEGGGKGALVQNNKSATLSTHPDQYLFQPVVYDARGNGTGEIVPTITDDHNNRITDYTAICLQGNNTDRHAIVFSQRAYDEYKTDETSATLKAQGGSYGGGSENIVIEKIKKYIVRRLTPTECARLQGFPDRWGDIDLKEDFTDSEAAFWQEVRNTHAAINGKRVKEYTKAQMLTWYNKLHTDSAEYKMWGNGIALPTALYIMQGIADELMEV